MKTNLITLSAVLLAATVMSCRNSADEKIDTEATMISYDKDGYAIDSSSSTVTEQTVNTTSSAGTSNNQGSTKSGSSGRSGGEAASANSTKGHSAPDGTKDENNDGDYYTKNNDKPMPSGTSIK